MSIASTQSRHLQAVRMTADSAVSACPDEMDSVLLRKQEPKAQPHFPIALGSCFRRSTTGFN